MDEDADKAMVVMMVMMTPMVAVMPSVRFYYDGFPVLSGLMVRRTGRRVVLCHKRRKIQGSQEQNHEQFLHICLNYLFLTPV
jgi:hypothetical protein